MVSVPLSGDWNALSTGEENSNISRVQESLGEDDELDRGLGLDRLPRFFPFFFFFFGVMLNIKQKAIVNILQVAGSCHWRKLSPQKDHRNSAY